MVGRPVVLGVRLDRFDHPVELIGDADLARHTVGLAKREAVGFGEGLQPIRAPGVSRSGNCSTAHHRFSFRQSKNRRVALKLNMREKREQGGPRAIVSAVEVFARGTPPVRGDRTARRLRRPADQEDEGGGLF
jgi:hypothetical protein